MSKNIILILGFILIIITILIWRLFIFIPSSKFVDIKIKETTYKIELAKTTAQKAKGLSKRDSLCPNCGMLFIFDSETQLPFWMKDTTIPLDIIWLDKNGKIVSNKTVTEINSLKTQKNEIPAQYVLELNANDYQKLNLKIGDIIQLPNFNE
jgi:uncharacterized protein